MRIESSIITSLSELRAIEQQRIADERAAIERTRAAEIEARRLAEQARSEAEQAKLHAEREERMRIEIARAEAEREARLRVEATEAAERARWAAQLEEQRLAQEMELRRAEVAKKRPRWMIAVTAIAALCAVGLTWFAIDRSQQMAVSDEARERATAEKEKAKADLREAQARLASIEREIDAFDAELRRLTKVVADAQNEADRKRAVLALKAADDAKKAAQKRLADEEARRWKKKRGEIIDVSECTGTALGCLEHE